MGSHLVVERSSSIREPQLERQGRHLVGPGWRFVLIAVAIAIPGVVLVVIDNSWSLPFGIALLLIASLPAVAGIALLLSGSVARWAARHRLFA
jgi:hypothetical protein